MCRLFFASSWTTDSEPAINILTQIILLVACGAANSDDFSSCKNQHLWNEHNKTGVATLLTGAHL